jgi:hypothetical protein
VIAQVPNALSIDTSLDDRIARRGVHGDLQQRMLARLRRIPARLLGVSATGAPLEPMLALVELVRGNRDATRVAAGNSGPVDADAALLQLRYRVEEHVPVAAVG